MMLLLVAGLLLGGPTPAGQPSELKRYFSSFAGYSHPLQLVGELSEAAAIQRAGTYYVGRYDPNERLTRIEKWDRGKVVAEYLYRYVATGKLEEAVIIAPDGTKRVLTFGAMEPASGR